MNQEIKFAPDLFKMVKSGRKTTTIRKGLRKYTLGPVMFVTDPPDKRGMVKTAKGFITKVELKQFKHLKTDEAQQAGYECLRYLGMRLRDIYPDIDLESEVTKVEFMLEGEDEQC